ncbi:MAG TPA: oligosaccharide flippase family protein, partial [Geminicoccaceae bacterium]|nr:oligosaccharide flippase family protein [Geminicoccaceae bacterium]
LAVLSSGTLLGQLLLVASSPTLTRLYGPEAFGVLAVFTALSAVLGMAAAMRYEFAVPVAPEAEVPGLVWVGLAAAALLALLTALGVWVAGPWLAALTATPALAPLLWLLPGVVLLNGLALPLGYWSIRRGTVRVNAANRLIYTGGQVVPQLALGFAGGGAGALVLGYAAGSVAQLAHLLWTLPAAQRAQLAAVRLRELWPLARRHWHYPAYSAPSALLQAGTQLAPAVLLAALYGPAAAGWFGLGQRVVGLPTKLLANAASQVFIGEAPRLGDDAAVQRLFLRSTGGFALLGLAGLAPVALVGPALFALVFGEDWRAAGTMAALLVPQHLARFVVVPVSQTLNLYRRQDLHLVASIANALAFGLAFGLALPLGLGVMEVVAFYSAGTTIAYLIYLWFAWRVARRGGLDAAAASASTASDAFGRSLRPPLDTV